jgi:hypothetical protein
MMLYNTPWDFSQLSTLKTGYRLFLKWAILQIVLLPLLIGDLKKITFFYGYKICKEHLWLLMKCQIFSLGFLVLMGFCMGHVGLERFFDEHKALITPLVLYGFTGFILLFYTALAQELDWRYQRLQGFL